MEAALKKSREEWQALLSPLAFKVTREHGTERPFTGILNGESRLGVYACVCCGQNLFESDTKFDAGCGWPSFFRVLPGAEVRELEDHSHGMRRVEVRCGQCESHLGHVFPDGPAPTGLRYCMNSVSLKFTAETGEVVMDT
ncbi:MAG: peptide-methionine (R)-S-oxide reductase MsrB [Bradymonadia bacterium]